jgi:shikimate dehydrogenase
MAEKETTPGRYAVMGNPVAHSKSPVIHRQFAHQFGHPIEYTALWVELDGFADAVQQFRAEGGKGLNVTVPFKPEAFKLADNLSDRAKLAGAVNTLRFEPDAKIFGDNTDGAGLVHDLTKNLNVYLRGKKILLLGAGGAARGVLGPLLQAGAQLTLSNRTLARAQTMADAVAPGAARVLPLEALAGERFDLVINATSAGLSGALPPLPDGLLAPGGGAYDLIYGPGAQPFLDWARRQGAAWMADGLGMLVEQAAESFALWRGVRPATAPVIAALRAG